MKNPMRRVILAALCVAALAAPASAQTLNIGLRQDPDVLDPTLGSSYVGRIVYAAMCDKLFDLDAKLDIVPQLATSYSYDDPPISSSISAPACCSRTAPGWTPMRSRPPCCAT